MPFDLPERLRALADDFDYGDDWVPRRADVLSWGMLRNEPEYRVAGMWLREAAGEIERLMLVVGTENTEVAEIWLEEVRELLKVPNSVREMVNPDNAMSKRSVFTEEGWQAACDEIRRRMKAVHEAL